MLSLINPTETRSWKKLVEHFEKTKKTHMSTLFGEDPKRFEKFSIRFNDILVDFSKNNIAGETISSTRYFAKSMPRTYSSWK
jgi:glucose-6-phosphate isomerase